MGREKISEGYSASIKDKGNASIGIAIDTLKIGKQLLIFVNTKRSAESLAEKIATALMNPKRSISKEMKALSLKALNVLQSPTKQCRRLAFCLEYGTAFHHSGLHAKQKEIVENGFKEKKIGVIVATPTLALGVDLPAYRVVIRDLKRYGYRGMDWIPVLEYHQMAGRAGRPSFDNKGEAITIAKTEAQKEFIEDTYLNGKPENVYSKLAAEPVFRTYLLSLISSDFANSKKDILSILSKTFWAHQYREMNRISLLTDKMLARLKEWGFITYPSARKDEQNTGFVSGEELNSEGGSNDDSPFISATPIGRRIAELYLDPLTAHNIIKGLKKSGPATEPFALLQLVAHTIEMRPLFTARVKEYEELQNLLIEHTLLDQEPSMFGGEYDEFINSLKTAKAICDWIDEKDEEYLLSTYNIRPGEFHAKRELADWLLYSAGELAKLIPLKGIISELIKLRIRVRYGVREELLPLMRLKGVGRVKARRMFSNRIRDIGDVRGAPLGKLSAIIGKKTAESVKEQVREKGKNIAMADIKSYK